MWTSVEEFSGAGVSCGDPRAIKKLWSSQSRVKATRIGIRWEGHRERKYLGEHPWDVFWHIGETSWGNLGVL